MPNQTQATGTVKISMRMPVDAHTLIDRAAQTTGKNRTEFMIEASRREAEKVLLDQRLFILNEQDFKKFTAYLDQPPADNPALKRLFTDTQLPWTNRPQIP